MDDIDDLLDEAEKVCAVGNTKKITSSDVNEHVSRFDDDILKPKDMKYNRNCILDYLKSLMTWMMWQRVRQNLKVELSVLGHQR